jgi:hypothetical protein
MGFKTCAQDEFDRAMKKFDKLNRQNKTQTRTLTLAEQIAQVDILEEKQRQERFKAREEDNKKRFSPMAGAKFAIEQREKEAQLKAERKKK